MVMNASLGKRKAARQGEPRGPYWLNDQRWSADRGHRHIGIIELPSLDEEGIVPRRITIVVAFEGFFELIDREVNVVLASFINNGNGSFGIASNSSNHSKRTNG